MRIIEHKSGPEYNGKQYYSFAIQNIPKKIIEESGFKHKDKLKAYVKEGKLIITKKPIQEDFDQIKGD